MVAEKGHSIPPNSAFPILTFRYDIQYYYKSPLQECEVSIEDYQEVSLTGPSNWSELLNCFSDQLSMQTLVIRCFGILQFLALIIGIYLSLVYYSIQTLCKTSHVLSAWKHFFWQSSHAVNGDQTVAFSAHYIPTTIPNPPPPPTIIACYHAPVTSTTLEKKTSTTD